MQPYLHKICYNINLTNMLSKWLVYVYNNILKIMPMNIINYKLKTFKNIDNKFFYTKAHYKIQSHPS